MLRVIRLLAILILLIAAFALYGNRGGVRPPGVEHVESERSTAEPPAWILLAPERR